MKGTILEEYSAELERKLRLSSFPLAVKMLEREGDIPEGALRPLRDLEHQLCTCQCFAMSRREKVAVAQLKEDMWCFEPVIGFGLAEPPQYFLDGYTRWPDLAKDLSTAKKWAQVFPRLEVGRYIGIVSAPLASADFEPDLVIIYGDAIQMNQVLAAIVAEYGEELTCTLGGHAGCVHYVVPAMKTGKCQISMPCAGDLGFAAGRSDEVVFTAPVTRIEGLLSGLKFIADGGWGLPLARPVRSDVKLPDSYFTIAPMLGMKLTPPEK